jgi:hypothetical protein
MRRPRFTIRGICVFILFVAFSIAALRESTDTWDQVVFAGTLLTLSSAILLVVHRSGQQRAYWLGFVVFGWIYLVASLIPSTQSRLPTTQALLYINSKMPARASSDELQLALLEQIVTAEAELSAASSSSVAPQTNTAVPLLRWALQPRVLRGAGASEENFLRIGHGLLTLLVALAGGSLSRMLERRNIAHPEASLPLAASG